MEELHNKRKNFSKTDNNLNSDRESLWKFTSKGNGSFIAKSAAYVSRLYFPLMSSGGMKSYVNPELKGDICLSFHQYVTAPLVTEEIHRSASARNFWILQDKQKVWSVSGLSAAQISQKWSDAAEYHEVEGCPGMFILRRKNVTLQLSAEIKIFIPSNNDPLEIMMVKIKNEGNQNVTFKPAYAIPLYGRSADNFRDHRQVTSMFQKARMLKAGVFVKPAIRHYEAGHKPNTTVYSVFAFDGKGNAADDQWVLMKDFIGEGGSLLNPKALALNEPAPKRKDSEINGQEAIAAFRWKEVRLAPGESVDYGILHCISDEINHAESLLKNYKDFDKLVLSMEETLNYWKNYTGSISIKSSDHNFDQWIRWIIYQVKCRQVFGNSYLPDFGYGRGGRGWRDLWQDLLAIFLVEQESAKDELINNFKGVRIDGSNATIIGTEPGTFKADRNNIARYWCDHGAWPVFVLNFYIDQTGDLDILLRDIPYWKDQFCFRTAKIDDQWSDDQGNTQLDASGKIYQGSLFEHVLLQTLSSYYHVGEHNNLLLEGADWNDTYDMARERGESVCFHHFYGYNLKILAALLENMKEKGIEKLWMLEEIAILLDTSNNENDLLKSPQKKQMVLNKYFSKVRSRVSGKKKAFSINMLIYDLQAKAQHVKDHILKNEWITTGEGYSFFNGHYDNNSRKIDGDHELGVRMDLPSQVMAVMCETAGSNQIRNILHSADYYLRDEDRPGLRLCTDFKTLDLNIGRLTGFTYGYKEHGSKWMQQNIMLAFGLYKEGYARYGYRILYDVYKLATDSANAKTFPGLPSFFEPGDRGAYAYLTGSSTWFMLTLVTKVFGIKGRRGDLLLEPKLMAEQFDDSGEACIELVFGKKRIRVCFINREKIDLEEYVIGELIINDKLFSNPGKTQAFIKRGDIDSLCSQEINILKIVLRKKIYNKIQV